MQAEARARVNLKQLVFSSLSAVMEADMKMSQTMIDTIMKFSDDMGHDDDGYPIVQLKTLQLVYDQLRHDDLDMLCTEKVGLEVPILSMIPLSSLKISKSKLQFSTEVQEVETTPDGVAIYTKVASAESERGGQSARIDFEIEMESESVAEGLARVIDQLGQNFIPTVIRKYPMDPDGRRLDSGDLEYHEKRKQLWNREQRISKLLGRLNGLQRTDEGKENAENPNSNPNSNSNLNAYQDLESSKDELEQQLAQVRKQILQTDVAFELERTAREEGGI